MTYTPTVFCEICDKEVLGEVRWHRDEMLVCRECFQIFQDQQHQEIRGMPNVPWKTLFITLGASVTTAYFVESWPLVDGIAVLCGGAAVGGLFLKAVGKARR